MKLFKEFLEEEVVTNHGLPVEFMGLHKGHEGVADTDAMLRGLHRTLLGKKGIDNTVDLKGTAITFGIHPKNKQFFVSSGGVDSFSPEEIDHNFKENPALGARLKAAMHNIPKVMPKTGGMFNGKLIYDQNTDKIPGWLPTNNANIGLSVSSNMKGESLSNKQKAKFQVHPDVYMINPDVRADTEKYDMDKQHQFHTHMKAAERCYQRVDPEAFDNIKGHETHIQHYLKDISFTGEKPSVEGYGKHLEQEYQARMFKAKDQISKTKIADKHAKLSEQMYDNQDHFKTVLPLFHHLHQARRVLSDTVVKNNNPGNVSLYKGDSVGILNIKD